MQQLAAISKLWHVTNGGVSTKLDSTYASENISMFIWALQNVSANEEPSEARGSAGQVKR